MYCVSPKEKFKMSYQVRNSNDAIASDSEESDSKSSQSDDDDNQGWKRRRSSIQNHEMSTTHSNAFMEAASNFTENRKHENTLKHKTVGSNLNVWSNVLEQRSLTEHLNSVGVKKNFNLQEQERGCESYQYPGWDRPRLKKNAKLPIWKMDSQEIHRRLGLKRSRKERDKHMSLIAKDKRPFEISVANTEEEIIKGIATILREPKEEIIEKVVSVLGKERALKILQMTEEIEECEGMMTADQSRRRTPGGVFFLLVRNDRDVTRHELDEIFGEERKKQAITKKDIAKAKRRMKAEQQLSDMKLFPTREELLLTDAAKSKITEAMDTNVKEEEKEPGELTDSDDNA